MSDWKNVQYKDGKFQTSTGGGGGGSSTFAGLDDVSFSNLQNGQVPKYNSTTQKWENANESGGGGTVTDVEVDGVSVVDPQTGVANITMPTPPTIPVEDVEVNGESVVNAQKVAEIKSYKEVTQAEYNALPDSKLNDGILYAIKDSAGADGFPPLIYSDEEREVGVWRDGKPLYQKTINIQNPSHDGNWHDIAHGISNPDIFANINGVAYWVVNADTIAHVPIPSRDETNSVNHGVLIRIVGSNLQYAITGYGSTTFSKMSITIQYTKTTDTAGSGTWTTQGGYAHHYSTTEQVIGTWIDGKPLYQKSISLAGISIATGQYAIVYTQANIELKYANGYFIEGNYVYTVPEPFLRIRQDGNNIVFRAMEPSTWNISGGFLTIQYTKTTD